MVRDLVGMAPFGEPLFDIRHLEGQLLDVAPDLRGHLGHTGIHEDVPLGCRDEVDGEPIGSA